MINKLKFTSFVFHPTGQVDFHAQVNGNPEDTVEVKAYCRDEDNELIVVKSKEDLRQSLKFFVNQFTCQAGEGYRILTRTLQRWQAAVPVFTLASLIELDNELMDKITFSHTSKQVVETTKPVITAENTWVKVGNFSVTATPTGEVLIVRTENDVQALSIGTDGKMRNLGSDVTDGGLRKFSIWSEGYSATGQSAPAKYHGTFVATNFQEACQKLYEASEPDFQAYFSNDRMSIWGCRLFDNESTARQSFG